MRAFLMSGVLAAALAAAGCATGGGYGGGYGGGGFGVTNLSQCMRNALIGAGVGAVAGAATAPEGNRTENAAIGAAIGGAGAFAVCRLLDSGEQARIENAYQTALSSNAPYTATWSAANGSARAVQVAQPTPAAGAPQCRIINATMTVSNEPGVQQLPTERYCQTATGWQPTA
jgi:hypothetical protein